VSDGSVSLAPLTREACHAPYRNRENDPALYADTASGNLRSRHVPEKAGLIFLREENRFRYYICPRSQWRIDAETEKRI